MKKLEGKVIFITGGGDGMGKATAIAAAKEGASVSIFELKEEKRNQQEMPLKRLVEM